MSTLQSNVGGFIKVRHLIEVPGAARACVALAIGLKAINSNQYKASTSKQVRKLLRQDIPVVFEGPKGDPYGDEAIPFKDAQLVLTEFSTHTHPNNHYYVHANLALPEGMDEAAGQSMLSQLGWLQAAKPDDYVCLTPRLMTTTLKTPAGNAHYVEDIGGVTIPRTVYSREDLLMAGYKSVLHEYDTRMASVPA